jgi:hypothetical protein
MSEMADRYLLIEKREAAVGVQMFHMRQRWGAAVWRAQTQVLLGGLKCALPEWEEVESRRAADSSGHGGGGQPVSWKGSRSHTPVGSCQWVCRRWGAWRR